MSRSCLHTRESRDAIGGSARFAIPRRLDVARNETHAARPPLLGAYLSRPPWARRRQLCAARSRRIPRDTAGQISFYYTCGVERGRVVYQQPSEPRFSPFAYLTPPFSRSPSLPLGSRGRSTSPLSPPRFSPTFSILFFPPGLYRPSLVLPRRARE